MAEEEPKRVAGKEYGVAGDKQLQEIKAVHEATRLQAELAGYYYPPGATEPVLIEE
jgi:hypothetical protein